MKILIYADSYNGKVGQGQNYIEFISQFGEPILVTADNDLEDMLKIGEILFLPGGADVDPSRYGEKPHYACGRPNLQYEWLDANLLDPWLKTGKPIIGICRGLQALNVACGGTLWQDLTHHVGGEDRTVLGHKLYTTIKGWEVIDVNSYHHQGIKDLAPGFDDIGYSMLDTYCPTHRRNNYYKPRLFWSKEKQGKLLRSKDEYSALVEVIKHKTKPYVAFQYHPEDFNCPFAIEMIDKMLKAYNPAFEARINMNLKLAGWGGGLWKKESELNLLN